MTSDGTTVVASEMVQGWSKKKAKKQVTEQTPMKVLECKGVNVGVGYIFVFNFEYVDPLLTSVTQSLHSAAGDQSLHLSAPIMAVEGSVSPVIDHPNSQK